MVGLEQRHLTRPHEGRFDRLGVIVPEHVQNAVRSRRPFVLGAPNCPAAKCIEKLAMRLEQGVANGVVNDSGFFNRMSRWFRR